MSTPTDGPAVRDLPPLRPLLSTPEGAAVHGFAATGVDEAITWWEWLRAIHPETGLWPVIVSTEEVTELRLRMERDRADPPQMPDPTPEPDAIARLAAGIPPEPPADGWKLLPSEEEDEDNPGESAGPVEARHPAMIDHRGRLRDLVVAMVPAAKCWEVLEALHFGGFNECPRPAEHTAITHRWHDRWGVELLAVAHHTLEFVVTRPPTTEADALELAAEYQVYNEGSAASVPRTARHLLNSRHWVAWWD